MIRPFTFVTMMLAAGSGLYLYSAKHRSQMLDREIGRTVDETDATRKRIDMLRTEWALLNEPDRLAELARAHLNLKTLAPTQFVAVNDLASRLPPPAPPGSLPPPAGTDTEELAAPPAVAAQAAPAVQPVAPPPPPARPAPPPRPIQAVAPVPAPAPAPAPAQMAAAAEPKPLPPKHVPPLAQHPVAVAAPVLAVSAAPAFNASAVAPGTIGASVLRAMRSNAGYAPPAYAPAPAAAYVPTPAYTPTYTAPTYTTPSYTTPSYTTPVAAPSSASLLGGARSSLPPPVPFAAR